jgi:hypothetical protein
LLRSVPYIKEAALSERFQTTVAVVKAAEWILEVSEMASTTSLTSGQIAWISVLLSLEPVLKTNALIMIQNKGSVP